jgi:ubiquinone/menaquinone biosynthesis C-methylase UbiE
MTRSARSRGDYWDRRAPTYDARTRAAERRLLADSRRWVCDRARGDTLEIAVGTGANLPYYPAGVDLTAVDASGEMLRLAERRASAAGRAVALRRADAAALPFPGSSFDTVVCTFAMCCVPDERVALAEAVRVLRPGGDLLLADHVVATFWPLRAVQHVANLFSVPLQGEHYTRRPLAALGALDVTVVDTERLAMGAIERVHARRLG